MLSFIAEHAQEDADALIRPDGLRLTYASLAMAAAAVQQAIEARAGDIHQLVVAIAVADSAGFIATLLAVLEAGGVALPLDPLSATRDAATLTAEAAAARAVALVVGDPTEDRLDVWPGDATRRQLPPSSALILPAGPRRAVLSATALASALDAIASTRTPTTRTALSSSWPPATRVAESLATLRAGGTLVDTTLAPAPLTLDCPEALRLGVAGDDRIIRPLPGVSFEIVDGELLAQAPWLTLGYLDDDLATRAAFLTRHGTLSLRLSSALEHALLSTSEAALIPVLAPDGIRLYAFIAGDHGPLPPAIKHVTLGSLPHTPTNTIDRRALYRMASPY
jgi:acyl-CoA synthetase (AMP-forming)/AMP-acid ligase II